MVGEQTEVSVRRDEGQDPLGFPALEPHARVEADIVQQPGVLGTDGREHLGYSTESNMADGILC